MPSLKVTYKGWNMTNTQKYSAQAWHRLPCPPLLATVAAVIVPLFTALSLCRSLTAPLKPLPSRSGPFCYPATRDLTCFVLLPYNHCLLWFLETSLPLVFFSLLAHVLLLVPPCPQNAVTISLYQLPEYCLSNEPGHVKQTSKWQ